MKQIFYLFIFMTDFYESNQIIYMHFPLYTQKNYTVFTP
jgi:hypothetical protein